MGVTQKKSIEHANWNVVNTWWRSLCLQWQLQDASSTKKLISHIVQRRILAHSSKQSPNVEGSGGPAGESLSSVPSTNVLLGSSRVIDWAIPTSLFSFSGTSWESPLQYVLDHCPVGRSTRISSSLSWWMATDWGSCGSGSRAGRSLIGWSAVRFPATCTCTSRVCMSMCPWARYCSWWLCHQCVND